MSHIDIVRSWKDARYRRSLTAEQIAALPANPAGLVELSDEELKIAGGLAKGPGGPMTTAWACTLATFLNWKACGCPLPTTSPICTAYWVCLTA